MRIQTLKDLKNALSTVPDEDLDLFEVGVGEGAEDMPELLITSDEENFIEEWERIEKNHPQINDIRSWIHNISSVAQILEFDNSYDGTGTEEGISSDDIIQKEVK